MLRVFRFSGRPLTEGIETRARDGLSVAALPDLAGRLPAAHADRYGDTALALLHPDRDLGDA
jgi:hypothetical protein